ncbi:MAG: DUF4105 domain-containing protein [Ferruginibacter sp.]
MNQLNRLLLVVSVFFSVLISSVQAQDSSHLRISLLTCSPGDELYSTFGHTAIRIVDSSSTNDIVFNYGTFDFDDPSFYMKFIRGKLMYYLSAEDFQIFKQDYQLTNRGITEQLLNLSAAEKIELTEALYNNIKIENRYYKYDFFFDNCTIRPRDLLQKYKANFPAFKQVMPKGTRFRQAIHQYLDQRNKHWSKLGIDILLGAPTDAVMTNAQSLFLPDNLMKAIDSSSVVASTQAVYPFNETANKAGFFTPLMSFFLLLVLIITLTRNGNAFVASVLLGFDGLLFFLTGALGVVLIFMWTATDHSMCKNNFNLLWAWPTHLIGAFLINSTKRWAKFYFGITTVLYSLLLLVWFFLPQQLNIALIPIVLIILYRSALKYFRKS